MDSSPLDDKSTANLQDSVHLYDLDNAKVLMSLACLMASADLSSWTTEVLCLRGHISTHLFQKKFWRGCFLKA